MEPNKKQFGNSSQGPAEWEKYLMSVKPGEFTPAPKGGSYRNRKDSKISANKIAPADKGVSGYASPKDRWEAANPDTGLLFPAKSKKAAVRKARKSTGKKK